MSELTIRETSYPSLEEIEDDDHHVIDADDLPFEIDGAAAVVEQPSE